MFAEWVAEGAIFGIKAFFAVTTFLLCGGTLLGIGVLIGNCIKAGSGD